MKLTVSLLIFFFLTGAFHAQDTLSRQHRIDSLQAQLRADSLHTFRFKKVRPYGSIDNRNSFLGPSNFNGFQLGVIANGYHTFGMGFYRLNRAGKNNQSIKSGYSLRSLNYGTVFYQYLLLNKKYFAKDLPFEAGYGTYRARTTDTLSPRYNLPFSSHFVPLSASIEFVVKPVRWIGLSVAVGYYYFVQKDKLLGFDGFYFPVGVWVDLRQVYRDIKYYGVQKKRYRREIKKVTGE